jgi:hypothetical protein
MCDERRESSEFLPTEVSDLSTVKMLARNGKYTYSVRLRLGVRDPNLFEYFKLKASSLNVESNDTDNDRRRFSQRVSSQSTRRYLYLINEVTFCLRQASHKVERYTYQGIIQQTRRDLVYSSRFEAHHSFIMGVTRVSTQHRASSLIVGVRVREHRVFSAG